MLAQLVRPLLSCFALASVLATAFAQTKPTTKPAMCNADSALDLVRQQVALTKTFNDPVKRITVLLRAANVLWSTEQSRARAAFSEAFELASNIEKENEQKAPRSLILRLRVADQRYVVIRAVARKDAAWARELTRQMLNRERDRENSSTRNLLENVLTADRLLGLAITLLPDDLNSSLELARISLRYPASFSLTRFLYQLASVNQSAADEFYGQALIAYGDKPMQEFLYLQAYPFGWRETLNTPVFSFYQVPSNLTANRVLRQQLVQLMIRRAQQLLDASAEVDTYQRSDGEWLPGKAHLLEGLIHLEPQVRESLPELLDPLVDARERILVSLPVETQKLLLKPGRQIATDPDKTFDERLESAQGLYDVNERNEAIASLVMSEAARQENLEHVTHAVEEISDSSLRSALFEWLYFHRALEALKEKQTDLAERLASKVDGMEQRAYLHIEIAKSLLRKPDSQTHGREVLDVAIAEAKKAGATLFSIRSLLTASSVYAKLDPNVAVFVFSDAINFINRVEAPDFVSDEQAKEIQLARHPTKNRGHFLFRFYMTGLDPESAFLEMAKTDFDTVAFQASALTDKFQRALTTIAVADACLQQTQQRVKEKPKKTQIKN